MRTTEPPASCCLFSCKGEGGDSKDRKDRKAADSTTEDTHSAAWTTTERARHSDAALIALRGGWFRMGDDDSPYPQDGEGPARDVLVDAFQLAATSVTVADFSVFVSATNYQTVAERHGTSFVFFSQCEPASSYPAPAQAPWWRQVPGACWQRPNGIAKNIDATHPVTHIAHDDALAYCQWSDSRLPTEAEWEFAARGPRVSQPYPWGDSLEPHNTHCANVWQGSFPETNSEADGYAGTAPVDSFGAHGFGHYNMIGNVWEWTADRFTNLHSPRASKNPRGPLNGSRLVAKGGSFLCHASYCARYRTSSRQALAADTTTANLGFRIARNA